MTTADEQPSARLGAVVAAGRRRVAVHAMEERDGQFGGEPYGVVIGDPASLTVDEAATARLRAA